LHGDQLAISFRSFVAREIKNVSQPLDVFLIVMLFLAVSRLVHDMQVGIVSQLKGADAVKARIAQVVEASRRVSLRAFHARHMSLPRELMGAFQC